MSFRVLIVGTVPYNTNSTSRAFDAYFHNWEKENLAQIFSHTRQPCKGHCGTLYQITDHRMLHRWFDSKCCTGKQFTYEELEEEWKDEDQALKSSTIQNAYKIGRRHTAFTHLLRGILWRKRFWCTPELNKWLDEFNPECVFLSFSDDYFIPQIALYVAKRYNIPIVSSIGDDYYFNKRFSIDPIYQIYKETYKALIRKVFRHKGSAIYISDKIRDKYNSEFGLNGETVYLNSTVKRKAFEPINKKAPLITYFGNIRMGRNQSLNDIGQALGKIDPSYILHIYSNEIDGEYYQIFEKNANTHFHGTIPYEEVQKLMCQSDITVVVEGFADEDVELSRYSLSTKAADALASGVAILTYGSQECGVIEYMQSTGASAVCTRREELENCIRRLIEDVEMQKCCYERAITMTNEHHSLEKSCAIFSGIVRSVVEG